MSLQDNIDIFFLEVKDLLTCKLNSSMKINCFQIIRLKDSFRGTKNI